MVIISFLSNPGPMSQLSLMVDMLDSAALFLRRLWSVMGLWQKKIGEREWEHSNWEGETSGTKMDTGRRRCKDLLPFAHPECLYPSSRSLIKKDSGAASHPCLSLSQYPWNLIVSALLSPPFILWVGLCVQTPFLELHLTVLSEMMFPPQYPKWINSGRETWPLSQDQTVGV